MKLNYLIFFTLAITSNIFAKDICIQNFSKSLCGDFDILDSVIVKSTLSKKQLQDKLDKKIQQIAFLDKENLYLIPSKTPIKLSKKLNKKDYIKYAQVNISQKRISSTSNIHHKNKMFSYIKKSWEKTKGKGVNIAIIDDGFDLEHEDLQDINLLFSYDTDNKNLDANPKIKIDSHGTQVAGVIFSSHNDKGVDGIAPEANLIAIRQTNNISSDTIISFTVADKANAHIINCSWNSPILLEPIYDVIKHISKDTAIVFAAGNNSKKIEPLSIEASIPEVITVGATQKYSNYGEMVDFIIPSGIKTTKANGGYGLFGGTSATAPMISGLLALKMSEYPDKHYKELINILKVELNTPQILKTSAIF